MKSKLLQYFILTMITGTITIPKVFGQMVIPQYRWLKEITNTVPVSSRFSTPEGFKRVSAATDSYEHWLRNLPLLSEDIPVKDYKGRIKLTAGDSTLAAVIAYNIKGKKLEQCMDIIMRLRAEYLKVQNLDNEIAFFMPINFLLKWSDWKKGYRPFYKGIKVNLCETELPDSTNDSFEKYLWEIFYNSSTQTAYFGYERVKFHDLQIGDFFVKKGKAGHAILVVDLAVDSCGNKIALIGHGDTPARQFYLLNYKKGQPWFPMDPNVKYLPMPFKKKMYWDGLRRF